jgi:phage terminase large subunit
MAKAKPLSSAESKIIEWRKNPVLFVNEVFGASPDPWQAECLTALEGHGKVSVRSAHGVGKTTTMSWAGWWFMATRIPFKVPATAPSAHQLNDVLLAEMAYWYKKAPDWFRDQFIMGVDSIRLKGREEDCFLAARTARKEQPEALQGFHSSNLLFLIDEASGIYDPIFEIAEGALSSDNAKVLMCANPTKTSGYFYNSHHNARHLWHTIKVSAYDSPRVSERMVESYKAQYGEDSNVFRIRVLGEFPTGDDDAVIPLYLVEGAIDRDVEQKEGSIIWGVDVARFGDDRTVVAKRAANHVLEMPIAWRNLDTMQVVGRVVDMYNETPKLLRPAEIMVDVIGLGAGVVDRLREVGLPVRGVNVSESAAVKEKYFRLRDELWFKGREWFEGLDCRLPKGCDELIQELVLPKYAPQSSGKVKVESKSDVKKRTLEGKSPDLADAFLLTFASNKSRPSQSWSRPKYAYL